MNGMYTRQQLEFVKEKVRAGEEPWHSAYTDLLNTIDRLSGTEARADADFNIPGAYIDGEGHVRNKKNLNHLGSLAHACALAYAVGEGASFGDRAAELLYLWADTNKA